MSVNTFLYLFLILDFAVGFAFGSLGHFFSLLCFPILALLRGTLTILIARNVQDEELSKITIRGAVLGAVAFFSGITLGVLNLIFIFAPRISLLSNSLAPALENEYGILNGVAGGLFCGLLYMLIYIIVVLSSSAIIRRINK